ncbi:MAG: recombinase family protein [Streptosporangiaceae bacterium]
MPLARTFAVALVGVEGHPVEVEADLASGLPGLHIVGLPDAALAESRDRVRAAITNSGEPWPGQRMTVSLSPASLPKRGSGFDLANVKPRRAIITGMRNALVYCRISRDREGAGLGVQRQRQDCEELAHRLGWTVVGTHTDNDLSAYSGKPRPGYRALLDDLEAGRATAVLVWHTDRLHRSPAELEHYIGVCEPRGVVTHTVKAGPLDLATPSGRMVARQLGAVARFEVEHKSDRQQRAREQAVAEGRWVGGRRPFGYEADGVTVRPDEAAEVIRATHDVLAGVSLHAIARDLGARDVRTSTGRPWRREELRRMLMRPRNAGRIIHRGVVQDSVTACWPPLVSAEGHAEVVRVLSEPARRTSDGNGVRWLGSGLYRCGVCASTGTVETLRASATGGKTRYRTYRCKSNRHLARAAEAIDGHVSAVIIERLSRPDASDLLTAPGQSVDVAALHADATAVRGRLAELGELYGDGAIDVAQLRSGTTRLRARLDAIESELAAAARVNPLVGIVDAGDVGATWEALDIGRKRAVLDVLMVVTVLPSRRGRHPGGGYFDPATVRVEPRRP